MLLLVAFVVVFGSAQCEIVQSVTSEGYPLETHDVITDDGYILGLKHIPHGRNSNYSIGISVFLMHGILLASNSFTYLGPDYSIAYNLVDAGFDVWMGNARGNKFSRRHVTLDPDADKLKFFNYSFEEIALHDLPAFFDYILNIIGLNKLHYIGHSQGGTVFLVLNSLSNAYQSKIASAHLLAGVGYQNSIPSSQLRFLSLSTDELYAASVASGNVELYPPENDSGQTNVATIIVDAAFTFDLPEELRTGTSTKQLAHYGQNIRDKRFERWNYGVGNILKYNSILPPLYDLSKINIKVTMHYSLGDQLQSEADALAMTKAMPNAVARKVANDSFIHGGYILSKEVKALVTDFIIESLKNS